MKKEYEYKISEGGSNSLTLLDYCFNATTKSFLMRSGLVEGMLVLEIGCGSGEMTNWIAQKIGKNGKIISIDNNAEQLKSAVNYAKKIGTKNAEFKCMDAYDIGALNLKFDLVYTRFLLHHLLTPKALIKLIYEILKPGGVFVAEEGIVNHAFVYPYSDAFGTERFRCLTKHVDTESTQRDGNFGIKLYHTFYKNNFQDLLVNLVAPVLKNKNEKFPLIALHNEFKETFIDQIGSEELWQQQLKELQSLIDDESVVVGYYQSCQVSGKK